MEAFEIAADGDGLGEECAVIQLKRRQLSQRIARQVVGLLDVAGHDADFDEGERGAFLGEKHPHTTRVRRGHWRVVEFHVGVPS